jgi:spore coat protein U-like protein
MTRRTIIIRGLLAASLGSVAAPVDAAGSVNCTLSTTALQFGQYVPSRPGPADFTATLTVACVAAGAEAATVGGTIALVNSGGASGRELAAGRHRLRYQLFMDRARSIAWGDGGALQVKSISAVVGPATPWRQSFTIYGRILARQSHAGVGRYTDRITAVLNY